MSRVLLLLCLLSFFSCASKPQLYPNQKYRSVGKEAADQDIAQCREEAEEFLDSPRGKKIVKGAGAGALIGGAIGAVGGLFSGDVAGGATRGAAMGGAGGAAAGALSPDEVRKRYVNKCLSDKGYQVLGWQ